MMDIPHRRDTDVTQRLDKQDAVLEELRVMLVAHKLAHELTDPAVVELVNILRGAKLLRRLAISLAALVGTAWVFFTNVWEHIHFTR